jgi:hypothetical protein
MSSLVAFGVAFDATSQFCGRSASIWLTVIPAWRSNRLGRGVFALARTAALAGFRLGRGRFGLIHPAWLFMAFDRRRIARDMTSQPIRVGLFDQGFVQSRRQFAGCEFDEGARERRFAGNQPRARAGLGSPLPRVSPRRRRSFGQTRTSARCRKANAACEARTWEHGREEHFRAAIRTDWLQQIALHDEAGMLRNPFILSKAKMQRVVGEYGCRLDYYEYCRMNPGLRIIVKDVPYAQSVR